MTRKNNTQYDIGIAIIIYYHFLDRSDNNDLKKEQIKTQPVAALSSLSSTSTE
jgi:hypothetical protein